MGLKIEDLKYVPDMPTDVKARKILIIGAGEIVRDSHLPAYKMAGYPVAGIYNRTVKKAQELADKFDIPKVYDDLDKLIADGIEMNAVFDIALPAEYDCGCIKKTSG